MKIRNYIKDNQESDLETGIAETESTQSEMSDESPIANSMKISSAKFTSQQLLERKRGKVKSSEALSFFNNLLKDAAVAAKLWITPPPPLNDISRKKRELFFKVIEDSLPGVLTCQQHEVWKRLGEHLQNRRKYLKDKADGKRSKRLSSDNKSPESRAFETFLRPGDLVTLTNRNKKVVGTGLFLCQKNLNILGSCSKNFKQGLLQ